MRVLSIGNSFSEDAQSFLHQLAASAGIELEAVNLYIGGCSLMQHWQNYEQDLPAYTRIVNGKTDDTAEKVSIAGTLAEGGWDVITLQQASHDSGYPDTYEPYLSSLTGAVRKAAPAARLYFHETWAYAADSTHHAFGRYGFSRDIMFRCIARCAADAAASNDLAILPVGAVVQALYETYGTALYRDGFHLSLSIGRYIASLVWLKTLCPEAKPCYVPETFSEAEKTQLPAINAAVDALLADLPVYPDIEIAPVQNVSIGFLGCGNVGSGVWKLINDFSEELLHRHHLRLRIKKILVRDVKKPRPCGVPQALLTDDIAEILHDPEITLVAEFMGGEQPATDYMLRAMKAGKTVITANKMALALNWHLLQQAAQENCVGLYYEASVCGAIPILTLLKEPLQFNRIEKLMGIINGTTNYILSRMAEEGKDYADVLADAQRLGLAEPDPAADVEGMDAGYKLSILSSLAFHARVLYANVYREGITHLTAADVRYGQEMGYVLKLLAIAKRSGQEMEVRVHPTFLPKSHPLASVNGSFNAVFLQGSAFGTMTLQGRGAGDLPTASAITGDILAAVHGRHQLPTFANKAKNDASLTFTDDWMTRCFIRISAVDQPGVLSEVAGCFAAEGVSIATMMQKDIQPDGRVQLIFITHSASEQRMNAALARLNPEVCRVENRIRVEE